jgi:uncharacterized protein (DUF433 family)
MHQVTLFNKEASYSEEDTELVSQSDPRSEVISIDPERMWGTPCIAGTRVPIKSLFDHLSSGISLEQFLDDFEGVPREKCVKALQLAFECLIDGLPDVRCQQAGSTLMPRHNR